MSKLHKDNKHPLEQELIGRNFIFDNTKASGRWFTRENRNFALLFNPNKNSPEELEHFKNYFSSSKVKFSLQYPLFSKQNQIKRGYITAAYLYCFSIFGYSWIKQAYLDSLRKIILNKYDEEIKLDHFVFVNEPSLTPWLGLSISNLKVYFVFGFNNVLTILPTFSNPFYHEKIDDKSKEDIVKNILKLNFNATYENLTIHFVTYYDKLLIMTDKMSVGNLSDFLGLLITNEGMKYLKRIGEKEYDTMINDTSLTIKELNIKST